MCVCVENPKTSHCAMALMQDLVLDQESSRLVRMGLLRFVDAREVQMKQANVMVHTARCEYENLSGYKFGMYIICNKAKCNHTNE